MACGSGQGGLGREAAVKGTGLRPQPHGREWPAEEGGQDPERATTTSGGAGPGPSTPPGRHSAEPACVGKLLKRHTHYSQPLSFYGSGSVPWKLQGEI